MLDKHRDRNSRGFVEPCSVVSGAHERLGEPQQSRLRARDLGHLLREVDLFILDCGHEPGNKWEDKINGFRHALEKILGIDPSTADSNARRGKESESDASSNGNG